ncbi:MAG TPA: peptidoglycan bridge formation glycyltransferase FemA/FemB family protein [Candidatus Saccharimonadia bacterium]
MKHGLPPNDWDHTLQMLGGSILQSRLWMLFQQHLGREIVWEADEGWQWSASIRGSHGLRYLHCAYGPAARDEAALSTAIMSAAHAAKELGIDFVRVEPQRSISITELVTLRARNIAEVDPQHTRIIDLSKSEAELRTDLASGHRNLVNGTKRRRIVIRKTDKAEDFDVLLKMLADTAKRSHVTFHPSEYFQNLWEVFQPHDAAKLYLAEVEGKPVAAALFYDWSGIRYYAHAGAYQEENRRVKASVSLVWQAIVDAKVEGLKQFDLWGVASAGDSSHHLASLSRFKEAFGGQQADYAGTWDIPVKPVKYAAYSLYRRVRGR